MKLFKDQFKTDERKLFFKQEVMNIWNLLPQKAAVSAALKKDYRNLQQIHKLIPKVQGGKYNCGY